MALSIYQVHPLVYIKTEKTGLPSHNLKLARYRHSRRNVSAHRAGAVMQDGFPGH